MRWLLACVAIVIALPSRAEACGTVASPFGTSSYSSPNDARGFLFALGGLAAQRPSELDSRTRAPLFVAGLGGVAATYGGVHVAPMGNVWVRGRSDVVTSTDLSLSIRLASDGFVEGGFGVALEAGGYARVSGGRAYGPLASVSLGAPAGVQATLAVIDRQPAVLVGFDLLRARRP